MGPAPRGGDAPAGKGVGRAEREVNPCAFTIDFAFHFRPFLGHCRQSRVLGASWITDAAFPTPPVYPCRPRLPFPHFPPSRRALTTLTPTLTGRAPQAGTCKPSPPMLF